MRVARDVLRVAGPDAASFLQGQLSQDVEGMAAGATAWSFVLQPQGKVDALVRVTRLDDESFALDVDAGYGAAVAARLERFKLRVKADVEHVDASTAAPFRWGDREALEVVAPDALAADETREYERWRVEAGLPAMGKELTDATIPEEAGLVDLAVSFTKGCYTGQELVARIDSRGRNVPRRLRRLRGEMSEGDELVDDGGKVVGTVTSAVDGAGLGYVSRTVEPPVTLSRRGVAGSATPALERAPVGMVRVEALPPVTLA